MIQKLRSLFSEAHNTFVSGVADNLANLMAILAGADNETTQTAINNAIYMIESNGLNFIYSLSIFQNADELNNNPESPNLLQSWSNIFVLRTIVMQQFCVEPYPTLPPTKPLTDFSMT